MLQGKYWDRLYQGGHETLDYGWRNNVIVDECRQLLAAFVKGDSVTGVQHIALGQGSSLWDDEPAVAPGSSTNALFDGAPVLIDTTSSALTIDYIDTVGNVVASVQDRVQVTVEIDATVLSIGPGQHYALREFALFGQRNGSDLMIDYVRHPVINIGFEDSLTRKIRLIF